MDAYQKRMMDVVTERDPLWGQSRFYQYDEKFKPQVLQYEDGQFRMNDKFRKFLDDKGCVLIARSNPRFDNFIERIPGEKQKYLSMWNGYVKESSEAYNPKLANSLGRNFLYIHTSGHCDMKSLRTMFELLSPRAILPIHTDNPDGFAELFSDRWHIIRLQDGDSFCQ